MKYTLPLLVLSLLLFSPRCVVAVESTFHVSVVTNKFVLSGKFDTLSKRASQHGVTLKGVYVEQSESASEWLAANLIIIDTPRGGDRAQLKAAIQSPLAETVVPWVMIGGGPTEFGNLPQPIAMAVAGYYVAGGERNFENLFAYLRAWYDGEALGEVPAPEPLPKAGIYHPGSATVFANWTDYLAWGAKRWQRGAPVLAVAVSDNFIANSQMGVYDSVIAGVERAGGIALVFWFDRSDSNGIQQVIGDAAPSLLVNSTHMIAGDMRQAEFEEMDIPVVMGLTSRQHTLASWREASQGIAPAMTAVMVAIPERWGMSDPIVLAAVEDGQPVAIPEQVDLLVERFMAIAKLQHQPRQEIRLALMFWNSPSGEKNLSASNLNVPRSIQQITQALAEASYGVEKLSEEAVIQQAQAMLSGYYHPEKLMDLWRSQQAVALPLTRYKAWFVNLPKATQNAVISTWGEPEQNWAVREVDGQAQFIIPAIQKSQWLWMPQPPRADRLGVSTHSATQVPGHLYMAAYLFMRESFAADALVHLGTHGTQEWTPGKDRGLWANDYPNLVVGSVPVFYPYIQDNIGEAVQAKRRGRATIISHQTPPFSPAGLYDELQTLHDAMHQYMQLEAGGVRDKTQTQIINEVLVNHFHTDLDWSDSAVKEDFEVFLPELHDHLHRLAQATTPLGLHTFGKPAAQERRIATVMQQLGGPFYTALGVDSQELFAEPFDSLAEQAPFRYLAQFIRGEEAFESISDPVLKEWVSQAIMNERHLANDGEIEALLLALRGRFVPPGQGGDPVRQPDTTSGTNLYAFDPQKIPSKAAYEASEELYQSLLMDYQQQHGGVFPDKLAFSLWSSEAIRTYGVMEAQIMRALGVKPEWNKAGRVVGLSVIPDTELKQPRVDVVIQITSVYRDQFDSLMMHLASVIEQLAADDPTRNVIAKHAEKIRQQLLANGVEVAEAEQLAAARLFSNAPGEYGSGVPSVAMDSTSWDDDTVLAETFIQSQSHIYTTHDWGRPVQSLKLLSIQLAGTDAVVLSRSSNLHGLLSTDHPYEYLGGLSAVVNQIDGSHPSLYISDSRQRQTAMTSASQFISSELRTRYQNPQWINAMKQEGYAGTVAILKVINNVFGWQVMNPSMIRADQWQALHDTYVMDQRDLQINEWFEEHNPTAQAQLIERMVEAIRKGYWQASEQTQQQLAERWQRLVEDRGADVGAEKTVSFIEQQWLGYGLEMPQSESSNGQSQMVEGQILQPQAPNEDVDSSLRWLTALLLVFVLFGADWRFYQYRQWVSHDK